MFPALCCSKLPSWVCLGKGSHSCKKQYCIGTWNVKSMNQGKLEEVKQEMARVNVNSLGISELKWTGMGEFNSDGHYIYYCRQESHRRNGVAIIVNKRVWNAVLRYNFKNDRMISVHVQGKSFNITVIQVYAPTINAKRPEVEWFYEEPTRPSRTNTKKKKMSFHYRELECHTRKSRYLDLQENLALEWRMQQGKG